jgi:type II secretory pathway component PulM
MNARALSYWRNLDARSQWLLAGSATLLLLAAAYAYVWQPASAGRRALNLRIPALQKSLAVMKHEAAELKTMRALPAVTLGATPRAVADAATLQAMFGAAATVTAEAGVNRGFAISIGNIAYPALLDRIDAALARFRLRVNTLSVKVVGSGNAVTADLVLTDDTVRSTP